MLRTLLKILVLNGIIKIKAKIIITRLHTLMLDLKFEIVDIFELNK